MRTSTLCPLQPIVRQSDAERSPIARKSPTVLPPLRGVEAMNSMGARPRLPSTSPMSPRGSKLSERMPNDDRSSDLQRQGSSLSKLSDSLFKARDDSVRWILSDNMEITNIDGTSMIIPSCQTQPREVIASIPGYFCYCSSFSLFIYRILSNKSGRKPTFQLIRIINLPGSHILSLTADKQTMQVAISSMDHRIHLYSLVTGEPTQDVILELQTPPVSIKFHPSIPHSLFLLHYSTQGEGELRLIHSITGKSVVVKTGLDKALALTCSPYSKELAVSFESGEILVIGLSADGTEEIYSRSLIAGTFTSKLPDLVTWNSKHNSAKAKSQTIKSNMNYVRKLLNYVSTILLKPVEPVSVSYDSTNHETLLVVFAFGLHCLFNTATGDCLVIYLAREGRQLDTAKLRTIFNIGFIDTTLNNADSKNVFTPAGTLPNGISSCIFVPGQAGKFISTDCDTGIVRFWSVNNPHDLSARRVASTAISGAYVIELDPSLQNEPIASSCLPTDLTVIAPSTTALTSYVIALVDLFGGISIYSSDFRTLVLNLPSSHYDKILSLTYDPFNPLVFCTAGCDGLVKQWRTDFMAEQHTTSVSAFACNNRQYQRVLLPYNGSGRFKTWKSNDHGKVAVTKTPACVSVIYAPVENLPYVLCSYINGDIRFFQKHTGRHTCDLISSSSFYDAGLLIPKKHHFFSNYDKGFLNNVFSSTLRIPHAKTLAWSDLKPQLIVTGWTDGCLRFFLSTRGVRESVVDADELVMSFRLLAVFSVPWFFSAPDNDGFSIRAVRFIPKTFVVVAALESGHLLFVNVRPLLSKTIHSLFDMCYEFGIGPSSGSNYSSITNDQAALEVGKSDTQGTDEKLYRQLKPLFTETASVLANTSNIFVFNLTLSYRCHLEHRTVIFQHSSYTTTPLQHQGGTPRKICCFDIHPRMMLSTDTDDYNLLALGDSMGVLSILHLDSNICTGNLPEGRILIKYIYTCLGTTGNRPTHSRRTPLIRALKFTYEIPTCILLSASSGDLQLIDYTLSRCVAQAKGIKVHNSEVFSMDIHPLSPYTCIAACQDNSIRKFSLLSCGLGMSFLSFVSLKYLWSIFTNRLPSAFATSILDAYPFKNTLFDNEGVRVISAIISSCLEANASTEDDREAKLSSCVLNLNAAFTSIGSFFHTNQSLFTAVVALIQGEVTPYTSSPAYGYLHIVRRVDAIICVLLPEVMQICQVPMFTALEEEISKTYHHICASGTPSPVSGIELSEMISKIKHDLGGTVTIYTLGADVCLRDTPLSVSNNITNKFQYVLQLLLLSHKYALLSDVLWQFGFRNEALQVSMSVNDKERWLSQLVHEAEEVARQGGFLLHTSISTTTTAASEALLREAISQIRDRYNLESAIPADLSTILLQTDPVALALYLLSEGRYIEAKIVLSFAIYNLVSTHHFHEFTALYGGLSSIQMSALSCPTPLESVPSNLDTINALYATASLNVAATYCDARQPLAAVCELLVSRSYDQAIRLLLLNRSVTLLILLLATLIKAGEENPRLLIPQKLYFAPYLHGERSSTNDADNWDSANAIQRYKALLVTIVIELYYSHVHGSIFLSDEAHTMEDTDAGLNYQLEPLLSASIGSLYREVEDTPFDKSGVLAPKCLTVKDVVMRYTGNYDMDCAAQLDEGKLVEHLSSIQGRIEFSDEPDAFSSLTGSVCKVSFRSLVHFIMKKLLAELHGHSEVYGISPQDGHGNCGDAGIEAAESAGITLISNSMAELAAKPVLPVWKSIPRLPKAAPEQIVASEKAEDREEMETCGDDMHLEQQSAVVVQSNTVPNDDELGDNDVFRLDVDPGYGCPGDDNYVHSIHDVYRHQLVPVLHQAKDGIALSDVPKKAGCIAAETYDLISKLILKLPVTDANWDTLSPYISFLAKYLPCTGAQKVHLPSTMPHVCICFLAAAGCSFLYGQHKTARTIALALNKTAVRHPETEVFSIKEIVNGILDKRVSVPPVNINGDQPLLYKGETYFDNSDGRCFSLFLFFDKYMHWSTSVFI
ncbi:Hypothetical protein GLP15_2040 [Giardia lamblia P15]|uniref:WD-repeat family protein n=1 Tax=Giardia intestinalis (strain P15) TaxID=658858 RepID=E1EZZ3_GIAIA|nr:Hypothetical protein GLP15_2040 [Giardia lamblia P15]